LAYLDYTTTAEDAAQQHYSRVDRAAGFAVAVRAAGVEPLPPPPAVATWNFEQQYHGWREWLRQRDRPTAVAAYSVDKLAALFAALVSLDLRVPRDLSVVVFENEPVLGPQPLTTLVVPQAAVGRAAVAMLCRRIESPRAVRPTVVVPFTTGPNTSIAEPKRSSPP
jgi:DNA-binding LacI/PurR family transcriptional regulator